MQALLSRKLSKPQLLWLSVKLRGRREAGSVTFKLALQNCREKLPARVQNPFTGALYHTDREGIEEMNDLLQELGGLWHRSLSPGSPRVLPRSSSLPARDLPWRFPPWALIFPELGSQGCTRENTSCKGETGPVGTFAAWNFLVKVFVRVPLGIFFSLPCVSQLTFKSKHPVSLFSK